MLENIPTDKRVMRQFLKCGYVDRRMLFPTEEGSPQGRDLSVQPMQIWRWTEWRNFFSRNTAQSQHRTHTSELQ